MGRGDGIPVLATPWRITFDTNPDDCNLSCVMCEEHSDFSEKKHLRVLGHRPHRRMDIKILRLVVAEMAPRGLREIIPSTMGEPLLYQHFDEILDVCREYDVYLNLTTNGTWPRLGPEEWGVRLCPLTSDVKVSWNGSTAAVQEMIMRGSSTEKRIDDLRAFLRIRDRAAQGLGHHCRVTLQCTFMESNLSELPTMIEMAADLGVDRVKGHQLWVHFPEMAEENLCRSRESRIRWNQTLEDCRRAAATHRRHDGSQVLLDNFLQLPLDVEASLPSDWVCPFLGREAWVNHTGRFDPCCAPDAERQSLGGFGLVTENGGLRGIWEGSSYSELLRGYATRTVCQKCNMRRPREQVT
jgi:MoaA/NifB/PqqE/SkfB family radical SAM enzyme